MPVAPAAPNPHFARIGGHEAIVRLVDAFYRAMDTLPEARTVRAMHAPDLAHTKHVLVAYLSEWMGGPRLYSPTRGAPMLRRRHQPFDIDASARDAWMACMRQAMTDTGVPSDLRAELDAAFYKVADFIRNTEPSGAGRPHPGRPREQAPSDTPAPHRSQAATDPSPPEPSAYNTRSPS